jgi:phosphonate degradation associated HDIG domain protein
LDSFAFGFIDPREVLRNLLHKRVRTMSLTITEIEGLFNTRGVAQYGREAVSQLEHALQCAQLAEQAGETQQTIAAALLHDVGHLLAQSADQERDTMPDKDDLHQFVALPFLRKLFDDAVLEPIRLHVDAKRYLCATDSSYWGDLSPASKHSLELQGGIYSAEQAQVFIEQPYAQEAVRLRRYDDLAKTPERKTPTLAHYIGVLRTVAV